MIRHLLLPSIAALLMTFAVAHAWYAQQPASEVSPPMPPPSPAFKNTVAGTGMVEASSAASGTGNIAVGSQLPGIVTKVCVTTGQKVAAGDVLFELDRRQTEAELQVRVAALAAAQAQLRKLVLSPRPEEVPPSQAQVEVAEANLRLQQDLRNRAADLARRRAVADQDVVGVEQTFQSAVAQLAQARANLALVKAGAWKPDLDIAAANVEQARAQVRQSQAQLDVLKVRALSDGTILQVNVRPGEYVAAASGQGLILMGNLDPLYVRVTVDEEDLPRLKMHAPARAKVRGAAQAEEIGLYFVRLEPCIVAKASMTGLNGERVDTRVVQLIYMVEGQNKLVQENRVLVGQLLDVFVDVR